MAADDPTLTPRRLHLGSQVFSGANPIAFDANGVGITYKAPLKGLDSPSGIKGETTPLSFGRGAWAEDYEYTDRTLVIPGHVLVRGTGNLDADRKKLRNKIEEVISSIPLKSDIPLVFWEFGEVRHIMVRSGGEQEFDRVGSVKNSGLVAPYSMQLVALDPIKLDGDGSAYTVNLATPVGVAGSLTYSNKGKGELAPVLIRITDCASPVITCNGVSSTFSGLTVAAGSWLELNFDTGAVTLDGVNARDKMTGRWLPIAASGYTVSLSATTIGTTGQMQIKTYNSFA